MGNTLFKDWTEMDSEEEDLNGGQAASKGESSKQTKTNAAAVASQSVIRRKLSGLNTSNESPQLNDPNSDHNTQTPITNKTKMVIADFDPRSPTSGIVRTPICYLSGENGSEAKANNANAAAKYSITDPRSPTNEYTRTPIHGMTNQAADLNHDDHDDMDDSNSSLETSSLISDSSGVCQQVPENAQSLESPSMFGNKFNANSNMPRHILQRKQMEKLNKKKLIDYDKENLKE